MELNASEFSGFEQDHVLIIFLDQICPSDSGIKVFKQFANEVI